MTGRRILGLASTVVALSFIAVGCSGTVATVPEGPYAEQIANAQAAVTSQFERDVLADAQVTREEYEEATQRFLACLEDQGVSIDIQDQAGYYIYAVPASDNERYEQLAHGCATGTNALIEPLYTDMLRNPNNVDYDTLIAQCFVDAGLVDPPFTRDDFQDLLERAGATSTQDMGDPPPLDPEAQRIMTTDEAGLCMANPSAVESRD